MTRSVCVIDTSVFCNMLGIPNMDDKQQVVFGRLRDLTKTNATFVLPVATILETGNHIGQLPDGRLRWEKARRLVKRVTEAIGGEAPWVTGMNIDSTVLKKWLDGFPENAKKGMGIADASIIEEWKELCESHRGWRVFIWSLDAHLQGYDRAPEMG